MLQTVEYLCQTRDSSHRSSTDVLLLHDLCCFSHMISLLPPQCRCHSSMWCYLQLANCRMIAILQFCQWCWAWEIEQDGHYYLEVACDSLFLGYWKDRPSTKINSVLGIASDFQCFQVSLMSQLPSPNCRNSCSNSIVVSCSLRQTGQDAIPFD